MEKLDAYCVVLNPEAQRRDDGPIDVAVVVAPLDQANYWSSTIRRAAKTGRWPVKTLPVSQPLTKNDYMENGFSAPVPPNARGKRFGIFSTDISRTDGFVENIYCISTEKSGECDPRLTYIIGIKGNAFDDTKHPTETKNSILIFSQFVGSAINIRILNGKTCQYFTSTLF